MGGWSYQAVDAAAPAAGGWEGVFESHAEFLVVDLGFVVSFGGACCLLEETFALDCGGWVGGLNELLESMGGWVGGWVGRTEGLVEFSVGVGDLALGHEELEAAGGWVGGWVGG